MLSSPLFGRPSKILDKMLQSSSGLTDLAPKLSRNLCQRFIANEDAPPDIYEPGSERAGSGSLVLSFASGLWNILTFGYRYLPTYIFFKSCLFWHWIWSKFIARSMLFWWFYVHSGFKCWLQFLYYRLLNRWYIESLFRNCHAK